MISARRRDIGGTFHCDRNRVKGRDVTRKAPCLRSESEPRIQSRDLIRHPGLGMALAQPMASVRRSRRLAQLSEEACILILKAG